MNSSIISSKKRSKRNRIKVAKNETDAKISNENISLQYTNSNVPKSSDASTTSSITNTHCKKRSRRRKRSKRKQKQIISQNKPVGSTFTKSYNVISNNTNSETIPQQIINKIHNSDNTQVAIKTPKLPPPQIEATAHNYIVMKEPPHVYKYVTLPFILKWKDDKSQQWIHKMSKHAKLDEKHLKLYSDQHFIAYIHCDTKKHCDTKIHKNPKDWGKLPQTDPKHLRIMAIVNTKRYNELITLRDICGHKHHTLLSHIKKTLCQQIEQIYGIKNNELKIYIHYRPTALLFHIHFVHKNNYEKHAQKYRDHFIDDILDNIEKQPYYYRDATLKHQIYFDRTKSVIFAKHMRQLMNMKGTHRWYDKAENKRPINRSMPATMDDDEKKTDDKIPEAYVANTSNPIKMAKYKPVNQKLSHKSKRTINRTKPCEMVGKLSKNNKRVINRTKACQMPGDYQINNKLSKRNKRAINRTKPCTMPE